MTVTQLFAEIAVGAYTPCIFSRKGNIAKWFCFSRPSTAMCVCQDSETRSTVKWMLYFWTCLDLGLECLMLSKLLRMGVSNFYFFIWNPFVWGGWLPSGWNFGCQILDRISWLMQTNILFNIKWCILNLFVCKIILRLNKYLVFCNENFVFIFYCWFEKSVSKLDRR